MSRDLGRPPVVALVNSINRKTVVGYHFADSEPVVGRAKEAVKNNNGATCAYLTKKKLHCCLQNAFVGFTKIARQLSTPSALRI